VLIRCDKCSTVYELDEKLLPAGGAPVQCSRCQYVFTAYPAPAAARPAPTPVPTPAPEPPAGAPARPATRAPRAAPPAGESRTADGRPIRKVPFPDEEPTPSPAVARNLARPAPPKIAPPPTALASLRWIIPLLAVLAAVAAVVAWRLTHRVTPEAAQKRAEGQSLLLRDDRGSLARATIAFADAVRADPKPFQASADRVPGRALVLEAQATEPQLAPDEGSPTGTPRLIPRKTLSHAGTEAAR